MATNSTSGNSSGGHSFTPFASTPSGSLSAFSLPSEDSYFNIDDILASQQKVVVKFEMPLYRLGFLNQSTNEEHLKTGLKMELPFWLVKVLGSKARQIVTPELPKQYKGDQRASLSADANFVDVYRLGPYFYSMGVKMLCFEHLESRELSKCLLETFLNRFRQIMANSQNSYDEDTYALTSKLDEMERVLFHLGRRSTRLLEQWERGHSYKITSSLVLLGNSRKRKHLSH